MCQCKKFTQGFSNFYQKFFKVHINSFHKRNAPRAFNTVRYAWRVNECCTQILAVTLRCLEQASYSKSPWIWLLVLKSAWICIKPWKLLELWQKSLKISWISNYYITQNSKNIPEILICFSYLYVLIQQWKQEVRILTITRNFIWQFCLRPPSNECCCLIEPQGYADWLTACSLKWSKRRVKSNLKSLKN